MSTEPKRDRTGNARISALIGVIASLSAGVASRWLLVDSPVPALMIIVVSSTVLLAAARRVPLPLVVACTMVAAVVAQIPGFTAESFALGMISGLLAALCLSGPIAIAAMLRRQQAFRRRGWELAALEARTRSSDIQAALQRERLSLTAEMHDGVGHRLTLIAVRLGQLSLNPALAPADRAAVEELRQASAEAAEELGLAVRLLSYADPAAARPAAPTPADAVEAARAAGIRVTADLPGDLQEHVSPEVRTALSRFVQEALTNAAKHAPGETVGIVIRRSDSTVVAEARNRSCASAGDDPSSSGGFGLVGLRHRASVLGGTLDVDRSTDSFTLTLSLPSSARPSTPLPETMEESRILAAESVAAEDSAQARRTAILLPAAILGGVLLVATGYLVVTTFFSVMPSAAFAEIEQGDDRSSVEPALPRLELLDAPRDRFPARSGEECRYYESEVSFFERRDVHVICFDGERVARTGTVPAP